MLDKNMPCVNSEITDLEQYGYPAGLLNGTINARLSEADRRAVDFLLDGDSSVSQEMTSPMAGRSFMERVNSVRAVLSLLQAMPTEEPPAGLVEATLRKLRPPTAGELDQPGQ